MNFHNVSHWVLVVKRLGPFWANSFFYLRRWKREADSPSKRKVSNCPWDCQNIFSSEEFAFLRFSPSKKVVEFLQSMGLDLTKTEDASDCAVELIGNSEKHTLTQEQKDSLPRHAAGLEGDKLEIWSRARKTGLTLTSKHYLRMKERCDRFVIFEDNETLCYGEILFFLNSANGKPFACIMQYQITNPKFSKTTACWTLWELLFNWRKVQRFVVLKSKKSSKLSFV